SFGNSDDHLDSCFSGLHDGIGSKSGGNKNNGDISACFLNSLLYRIKYRPSQMFGAAFARGHTTDNIGSVFNHLTCVKCSLRSGESLHDNTGVFIYQYAHVCLFLRSTKIGEYRYWPKAKEE